MRFNSQQSPLTVRQVQHWYRQAFSSQGDATHMRVQDFCRYSRSWALAGEQVWGLGAFCHWTPMEDVLRRAQESQERFHNQTPRSWLEGVPVSIKANLAVAQFPLTAGSRILSAGNHDHADNSDNSSDDEEVVVGYDAQVVQALQDCGAIVMGITTMDEFGMGSLGTHQNHRKNNTTRNPVPYLHQMRQLLHERSTDNWLDLVACSEEQIYELHEQARQRLEQTSQNEPIVHYAPGGSSCGSAVSVAHGSSLVSLGSDTGGSVRLPAAWCHVVGLKPTYGRLSRHGLVSYASSLDTVGILASSSDCVATTLHELTLYEKRQERSSEELVVRDSTQTNPSEHKDNNNNETEILNPQSSLHIQDCDLSLQNNLSGMTIGIPESFSVDECSSVFRDAWHRAAESCAQQGATIRVVTEQELSPQLLQHSLAAYYVLVSAEASSNLARYDGFRYGGGNQDSVDQVLAEWDEETSPFTLLEHQFARTRSQGFGLEVIRRILCGTAVLSSDRFHTYYEAAAKLRAALTQQLHACLTKDQCDVLLVPTAISFPPKLDASLVTLDPVDIYSNDVMTVPASLAGLPALSVPIQGNTNNNETNETDAAQSPFSPAMQLIGPRMSEASLLKVAKVLEACQ